MSLFLAQSLMARIKFSASPLTGQSTVAYRQPWWRIPQAKKEKKKGGKGAKKKDSDDEDEENNDEEEDPEVTDRKKKEEAGEFTVAMGRVLLIFGLYFQGSQQTHSPVQGPILLWGGSSQVSCQKLP